MAETELVQREDIQCQTFSLVTLLLVVITASSIGIAYTTRANAVQSEKEFKARLAKVAESENDISNRIKKLEDSEKRNKFIEMDLNLREQELMGKIEISHLALLDLTDQVQVIQT